MQGLTLAITASEKRTFMLDVNNARLDVKSKQSPWRANLVKVTRS